MSHTISYVHIEPESRLPDITDVPSRVIVIVEQKVSPEWQAHLSDWIVRSGCLYMMAWGIDCSSWNDSVDWANIDKYGETPIPENGFVVTTWHSDEPLEEVFWYSKHLADHPVVRLNRTVLLDISTGNRRVELLDLYAEA